MLLFTFTLCLSAWCGLCSVSPPAQVAIAAGSQGDREVAFTWITNDTRDDDSSCLDAAIVNVSETSPVVRTSGGFRWSRLRTTVECGRYTFRAAASTFGNYTSGRIHKVRMYGLRPDTLYWYKILGDTVSTHRHFRTLPSPSKGTGRLYPVAFGVIGDLGQTDHSQESVQHLDMDPDLRLILHPGDMSYADTNGPRWDSYGRIVEYVSSRLQWMVCPGNHEIEADAISGQTFVPYEARYAMPALRAPVSAPSPEKIDCGHPWPDTGFSNDCTPSEFIGSYDWGNSFYAFTAGPARVISLNSYTSTEFGSAQRSWLISEFANLSARRVETPWVIVMMHCPWYSSNTAHLGERQAVLMRDAHGFEDLFMENNVSIVFNGHVHAYERTHAVYRNLTTPGAPSYIVVGDGGNREGHARDYLSKPKWSAYRNGLNFGHGKLVLHNDSHMEWQWWANNPTVNSPRIKEDSAWIVNPLTTPSLQFPQHFSDLWV